MVGAWLFVSTWFDEFPQNGLTTGVLYHEDLVYYEDFGLQGGDEVTTSSSTPHVPDTTR